MKNWVVGFVKRHILPRPFQLDEDRFQELRGLIIRAIGEAEIRISFLEKGGQRTELDDLKVQAVWREVEGKLTRLSKHDELTTCCREIAKLFESNQLDPQDYLVLAQSYVDEFSELANKAGFELEWRFSRTRG